MIVLRTAACIFLLTCGMLASALAQSPKKVPGSWSASGDKFGLLFDRDDTHPYFAYGNCDRQSSHPQATLNLELDPKLFGDAIAAGKYIIVKWTDNRLQGNLIAERLTLVEDGPFRWSLFLTVSLETLAQWQVAPRLQMTLGVGEFDGSDFESRQSYIMPDDSRQTALAAFISSCSKRPRR